MSEAAANQAKVQDLGPQTVEDLVELIRAYAPNADFDYIRKAYAFSEKAHSGQIRRSGDPYILHPLGVAAILAELHMDVATVATGLLHDTVEDTEVTLDDIKREFGETVAKLTDGVTKISLMKFRNTHEKQGENIRKMIVAMGKDVRVVLVKLADRLHNMRTLNHMPPDKQARIALETLDIYAPLASRLGINRVKIELEDLSFRYAYPDSYYALVQKVAHKKREREKYIDDVKSILTTELEKKTKIKFEVSGRPKHLWSIYRKMQARNIDYEQVFDVLAFRVNVNSIAECYEVLGMVHSLWKPIPGRFKDFIAMPKNNNYQSLHTTVIGPGAERIEIQIRTYEMHQVAERGIAAHWQYKEGDEDGDSEALKKFNGLRELVKEHQQNTDADEFLENFKTDLFDSEIYVFTPKGDVKDLPEGATPIDFAYAVHTDVGSKIVAARINGKLVSLKHRLQNGDTVEVITSKTQTPSKDWLKSCVTTKAKSKIRQFVKAEARKRAAELGKDMLEKVLRKAGISLARAAEKPEFNKFSRDHGCATEEDLFVKVGYGAVTPQQVVDALQINIPEEKEPQSEEASFLKKAFQAAIGRKKQSGSLIRVDGMNDVLVRFAKCCNPIPGDSILGFITLGRGIVIHRSDCPKAFELDQDRRIDVQWSGSVAPEAAGRTVTVRVVCNDTAGMLKSMGEVFSTHGINILNAQARTTKDLKAICTFDVSVKNTQQLAEVMGSLSKLKGVIGVTRITHA
jgi:GTP pyrophosphokinase